MYIRKKIYNLNLQREPVSKASPMMMMTSSQLQSAFRELRLLGVTWSTKKS